MYVKHQTPPKPAGWATVELDGAAAGLTVPSGARYAKIMVRDNNIRYRDDGIDPTDTVGFLVEADEELELTSAEQLAAFKAIKTNGTANLEILFYKI